MVAADVISCVIVSNDVDSVNVVVFGGVNEVVAKSSTFPQRLLQRSDEQHFEHKTDLFHFKLMERLRLPTIGKLPLRA